MDKFRDAYDSTNLLKQEEELAKKTSQVRLVDGEE